MDTSKSEASHLSCLGSQEPSCLREVAQPERLREPTHAIAFGHDVTRALFEGLFLAMLIVIASGPT